MRCSMMLTMHSALAYLERTRWSSSANGQFVEIQFPSSVCDASVWEVYTFHHACISMAKSARVEHCHGDEAAALLGKIWADSAPLLPKIDGLHCNPCSQKSLLLWRSPIGLTLQRFADRSYEQAGGKFVSSVRNKISIHVHLPQGVKILIPTLCVPT